MAEPTVADVVNLKAAFDAYALAVMQGDVTEGKWPVLYPALGLCGEAGEVAEKIKKLLRDKKGNIEAEDKLEIAKELGDVLWYIAKLCKDLKINFHIIPLLNINKVNDRMARDVVHGEGDNR